MEGRGAILAAVENFGRVYRCGECEKVHLQVGAVNVALDVETYIQLVALINTSAANFEASIALSGSGHV